VIDPATRDAQLFVETGADADSVPGTYADGGMV